MVHAPSDEEFREYVLALHKAEDALGYIDSLLRWKAGVRKTRPAIPVEVPNSMAAAVEAFTEAAWTNRKEEPK